MEKEEKAIVAILILQPILIFDFFLFLTVPHGRVLYAWPAEVLPSVGKFLKLYQTLTLYKNT